MRIAAILVFANPIGLAAAGPLEDANRAVVTDFYDLAFVKHRPTEAVTKHFGPVYIQHNPRVPNGPAAFQGFFERYFKDHPTASANVKRVIADGDLVAIHSNSKSDPQDRGRAIVDIFRVADGKIVEHWDVVQDVPDSSANGNTMFDGAKSD